MFRNIIIILVAGLFLAACNMQTAEEKTVSQYASHENITQAQAAYLGHIASLCGQSFQGRQTFIKEGRESWEEKNFLMHVTVCNQDSIHVPFHLDEDHSRTWMFIVEKEGGLRFRHDHRYEDGTPHEVTLYGGFADDERGTEFIQYFPADQYTCEHFPRSCSGVWTMELAPDLSLITYSLYSNDELIFQGEFDLTTPLEL